MLFCHIETKNSDQSEAYRTLLTSDDDRFFYDILKVNHDLIISRYKIV